MYVCMWVRMYALTFLVWEKYGFCMQLSPESGDEGWYPLTIDGTTSVHDLTQIMEGKVKHLPRNTYRVYYCQKHDDLITCSQIESGTLTENGVTANRSGKNSWVEFRRLKPGKAPPFTISLCLLCLHRADYFSIAIFFRRCTRSNHVRGQRFR